MNRSYWIVGGVILFGAAVAGALFWSLDRARESSTRERDILMASMAAELGNSFHALAFGNYYAGGGPSLLATTGDTAHWNADSSVLMTADLYIRQRDVEGTRRLLALSPRAVQSLSDTLVAAVGSGISRFRVEFDPPLASAKPAAAAAQYVLVSPYDRQDAPAGDVLVLRYEGASGRFILE